MAYCHSCGTKLKEKSSFCSKCGQKTKIKSKNTNIKQKPHISSSIPSVNFGSIFILIIILLVVYVFLNVWAIDQVYVDTSPEALLSSLTNSNVDLSITRTNVETQLTVVNPTFVPVIMGEISYNLQHGETVLGEGLSGFVVVMPNSNQAVDLDFELNNIQTGLSGLKALFGSQEKYSANIYAGLGPLKFRIGGSE